VIQSRHPLWEQATLKAEDPTLARHLDALHWRPTRWRGALVVSVRDGQPRAIVQLPGPNIWPFAMAVAFVFIFAGALLDDAFLLTIGLCGTALALVGWFWPTREQGLALAEMQEATRDPTALPLATGRDANGWWGALVFLAVLATALVTLVASYFLLRHHQSADYSVLAWRDWMLPGTVAGALFTAAAGMVWHTGILNRRETWLSWIPLGTGVLMSCIALYAIWQAFAGLGVSPRENAYGSIVLALFGFQWVVVLALLFMQLLALVWALLADDPRGHTIAGNTALLTWFAVASWVIVAATVYLGPLL
jgi:hypothetical protein